MSRLKYTKAISLKAAVEHLQSLSVYRSDWYINLAGHRCYWYTCNAKKKINLVRINKTVLNNYKQVFSIARGHICASILW